MASNRKEIWLIDTLRRHPGVTFEDIEKLYTRDFKKDELPKRTFRNMLEGMAKNHGTYHVCKSNRYSLMNPNHAEKDELLNLQISRGTQGQVNVPTAKSETKNKIS